MSRRRIILAARPVGVPRASDFRLEETTKPETESVQIVVKAKILSVAPSIRGRMNDTAPYADPVQLGDFMTGEFAGRVIQSRNHKVPEEPYVSGQFEWQGFAVQCN
ncbi:MAG: hypothetical protein MK102_16390 [Fuerstiella sp.]|nr:hypothetical protein [Fuerstiella sp.]